MEGVDLDKTKPSTVLWFDNQHIEYHVPEDSDMGSIQFNTFKYFFHPDMITKSGCVTLMTLFLLATIEHSLSKMLVDKNGIHGKYMPLIAVFATSILGATPINLLRFSWAYTNDMQSGENLQTSFVILIFLLVSCVYMGLTKDDSFPQFWKTWLVVIGMALLVIFDNIKHTQGGRLKCPNNLHYINLGKTEKKKKNKTDFEKKMDSKRKISDYMGTLCVGAMVSLFVLPILVQFKNLKKQHAS